MFQRRIIVSLLAAFAVAGCSSEAPTSSGWGGAREGSTRVIAEPVRFAPAVTRTEAVGTSRARLSTDIYPAISGEVVEVLFEPGEFVRKGDILAEIDSRRERLAVETAELRLRDAERLYERYKRSASSGAVDANTLDAARTSYELARVELEQARVELADRTIRAPFDGHVGATDVDIGDRVTPSMLVTTIDDRSTLLVRFDVPEAFIGELTVGESVELEALSRTSLMAMGEVIDIGSRIDPQTRTFTARARVSNPDDILRPGMSFRVGLEVEGQRFAVVPETAVQWGTDGAYIWQIVDGKAVRSYVQVVQRRQGTVLIDAEIEEGTAVIVEGTQRVRNGAEVEYESSGVRYAGDEGDASAGGSDTLLSD